MRQILALSMLLVLVGCATTGMTTSSQYRESACQYQNYNQYWGDCYIKLSESDPNFSSVITSTKDKNTWAMFKKQNNDISRLVANNYLTVLQGNQMFEALLSQQRAQAQAQAQARQQAVAQALLNLSQIGNTNSTIAPSTPSTRLQGGGFKDSEYVAGMNKICIYNFGGTKSAKTIPATSLCPLTYDSTASTPYQSARIETTYFKESEYVAGMNKICIYNFGGTKAARTIPATSLCPLTITE